MDAIKNILNQRLYTLVFATDGFMLGSIPHYFLFSTDKAIPMSLAIGAGCAIISGLIGHFMDKKRLAGNGQKTLP